MKSEIYLLVKKLEKWQKNQEKKTKIPVYGQRYD